jgi:hypothetical protein
MMEQCRGGDDAVKCVEYFVGKPKRHNYLEFVGVDRNTI